jgi:hypothetical protein
VFAAVCVLLAALGHVLMSEATVPWWALAAGAAATGGTAWCLAGRERGLCAVVAFAVAAQTVLHSWFSLAQSPSAQPAGAHPPGHGEHIMSHMGHGMGGMTHMEHGTESVAATGSMGATSSVGMLAAHLLAALLCGLWLAYGERAAFRILRALAGWLIAPLRLPLRLPAPPHRPRVRARRGDDARAPRRLLLVHAITSRGPPVGTAVR